MKLPIESRVLRRIRGGDKVAVRRFWSRIEDSGAPLVEPLPGESKHCLVTFLWRSRLNCDVSVLSALDTYSRDRGRLTRLPGTDIWYKTYRVRSDVRTIYHFTDVCPPQAVVLARQSGWSTIEVDERSPQPDGFPVPCRSGRPYRQLVVEGTLLAVGGIGAGLILAWWGLATVLKLLPKYTLIEPGVYRTSLNLPVVAFAVALALLTGVVVSLLPALRLSTCNLNESLKQQGRTPGTGARGSRLQRVLIVSEVALALVLLVGAGLID